MSRPSSIDHQLPIDEVERHPMWTAPKPEEGLPQHIFALRLRLHSNLQRFDGRPNSENILGFARTVYSLSALQQASATQLIGQIVVAKLDWRDSLSAAKARGYRHADAERVVVEDLADRLINAILGR